MDEDDPLDSSDYYRDPPQRVPRKRKSTANNDNACQSSSKQDNVADILPVILESQSDRNLRAYSPLFVDNCLRIGAYLSCSPLGNGNLMIKCSTAQQMKTLLSTTSLSNGITAVPVKASHLQIPPPSAKGVIYRVLVGLKTGELLQALKAQHVKFVKRFHVRSADTSELKDTGTVPLHFSTTEIPAEARVGYLIFKVRQYIPKPVRCFNCNRFGHISSHCKSELRWSNCGGDHKWNDCTATISRCPNCRGQHSATSKQCPGYIRESKVLHIKTVSNLSYAEACIQVQASVSVAPPNFSSESEFPPVPQISITVTQRQADTGHERTQRPADGYDSATKRL